jgi:hypothetical protein
MRYIIVFPFRFILFSLPRVYKKPKNTYTFHCPISFLAFAILFQICFVELVSVVESYSWFSEFVIVVQSPIAVLFPPLSHPPLPIQQVEPSYYLTCPASRLVWILTAQALDRLQAALCLSPCIAALLDSSGDTFCCIYQVSFALGCLLRCFSQPW